MAEALPYIMNEASVIHKGLCKVGEGRTPKPFNLYYELHGAKESVTERILLIMGMNATHALWDGVATYYAEKSGYQVLLLDNRGVGNSDVPDGKYTTEEMAKDTIDLLDFVGWKDRRSVHVVGVSMGGMITMHLALLVPERLASALFLSTSAAEKSYWPPLAGIVFFFKLMFLGPYKSDEWRNRLHVNGLLPASFLDAPGTNNRSIAEAHFLERSTKVRRQTTQGQKAQLHAGTSHRMSKDDCKRIADNVSPILIVHGDADIILPVSQGIALHKLMPGSELVVCEGVGHAVSYQAKARFLQLLDRHISQARQKRSTT